MPPASKLCALLFTALIAAGGMARLADAGEYALVIDETPVNVTGKPVRMLTVNGTIPGPTLHFTEGEDVVIRVTNRLAESASVHWHGILLPPEMDGVPGMNGFDGIMPGQTFTYRFRIRQSGTYWYHSHSGLQEQAGLYGPIIVSPAGGDIVRAERDYVMVLSDFPSDDPRQIMANLKADAGYYNYNKRTVLDFFRDAGRDGFAATIRDRLAWGRMRMEPTDIADVGSGYTFLLNGKSPQANWTGLFRPGERVRLRFVNASAMTYYDLRIPGLKMTVIQADGQNVQPVPVDELRIAVAETYDVMVTPEEEKPYTVFAESIDRSGYARGTLSPQEGLSGDIPAQRPRTLLTMADMGNMAGMDHGSVDDADPHAMEDMDHGGDMAAMPGMDHGAMSAMDHTRMDPGAEAAVPESPKAPRGWADASTPRGMKALSYADLRSFTPQKDTRAPGREIIVRLDGNMERFIWTINGRKFEDARPIELRYGERVKLTFINDSMMAHPMHLHGMFVQLVNGQPAERLPNKHVVNVAPGQNYSVLLTADEAGEWAFHCHLLFHMNAGMMTKAVVARLSATG